MQDSAKLPIAAVKYFPSYFPNGVTTEYTSIQKAILKVLGGESDFTAFLDQYETLAEFIPDENKRVAAALKSTGLTSSKVISALADHKKTLADILKTINTNLDASEVAAKKEVEELTGSIKYRIGQTEATISQLEGQLSDQKSQKDALQKELVEAAQKNQATFDKVTANREVAKGLNTDVTKVLNSLSEIISKN